MSDVECVARTGEYLNEHTKNFVKAIKANDPSILKYGIETGSIAAINAHMGNIACKTSRKVFWDPATKGFKNDIQANALLNAHYHNSWKLPIV